MARCPHCNGRVEPRSNGNGAVRDVCTSCGRLPDSAPAPAAAAPRPRFTDVAAGSACPVKDCPGAVDGSGRCACCAKREAYRLKHIPVRHCLICNGLISERFNNAKFCKACRPIVQRVSAAKYFAAKSKPAKKK